VTNLRARRLTTAALVLAAFVVFRLSPNRAVGDSFYSTLLSWSVMTTGSVHVESFLGDATAMRRMPGFVAEWGRPYQIEPAGGHLLYWYPPAPASSRCRWWRSRPRSA
jgi:hypothetical protein